LYGEDGKRKTKLSRIRKKFSKITSNTEKKEEKQQTESKDAIGFQEPRTRICLKLNKI
jgi:soluble cytochrome b562